MSTGNGAVSTEILTPIVSKGDDLALIFIPDSFINGNQYRNTAKAIQAASDLRIWIALTTDYFLKVPDPHQIPEAIETAIQDLKTAGFKSKTKNYIGVGHGMGGHFLQNIARTSEMKAIILMGANLLHGHNQYPLPILTLAAELDGLTRITKMAAEYEELKEDVKHSFLTHYKRPIVVIEGANHAQFASGSMPGSYRMSDLSPDGTEEDAHIMIGKYVHAFLTAIFSSQQSSIDAARVELDIVFAKSAEIFQPLLDMKTLDVNGNVSQWTIMAQKHFAGDYSNETKILNRATDEVGFVYTKPTLRKQDDSIIIDTISYAHYENKNFNLYSAKESPVEVRMKLKSKEAIWQTLHFDKGDQQDEFFDYLKPAPNTCKSLNELALHIALNNSSPQARTRYENEGRQLFFDRDFVRDRAYLFSYTHQRTQDSRDGRSVRAISYHTPLTDLKNPGMQYCTVMSPYSAMEWIYIDSLRSI